MTNQFNSLQISWESISTFRSSSGDPDFTMASGTFKISLKFPFQRKNPHLNRPTQPDTLLLQRQRGIEQSYMSWKTESLKFFLKVFFHKLTARLVNELDRKTLGGLESSGNKLSRKINPILLAYFLRLLWALKHEVVGQNRFSRFFLVLTQIWNRGV